MQRKNNPEIDNFINGQKQGYDELGEHFSQTGRKQSELAEQLDQIGHAILAAARDEFYLGILFEQRQQAILGEMDALENTLERGLR